MLSLKINKQVSKSQLLTHFGMHHHIPVRTSVFHPYSINSSSKRLTVPL